MIEINDSEINETQIETLESEIKVFADKLPYWSKHLANKILSEGKISEVDVDLAYQHLMESIGLAPVTNKTEIAISYNSANSKQYKSDLIFHKLENVEGVNALAENQILEFSPNVTIIYGANGSGKSGYTRLLKKVFNSKAPEEIIQNVHIESGHMSTKATFTFNTATNNIILNYPDDISNAEFKQFSVFDGKCVIKHLDQKNQFEFRPAGLEFFSHFTDAIKQVEAKLQLEIHGKQSVNNFGDLFEGESEIKAFVLNLSFKTKLEDLKKYIPFTEVDKAEKAKSEKEYDDLLLASKGKKAEIKKLESIKQLIDKNKENLEKLNKYFTDDALLKINSLINECLSKVAIAKREGIENFDSKKIKGIGTDEWKQFISSAEKFAQRQKEDHDFYPIDNDNCLLCHQKLDKNAQDLISNYWIFIHSLAEQDAVESQNKLKLTKVIFQELNFDLFPEDNSLTIWLKDKHPLILEELLLGLHEQKEVSQQIILSLGTKKELGLNAYRINTTGHDSILILVESALEHFKNDTQTEELNRLLLQKTLFAHREKLEQRYEQIENYVTNEIWIKNSSKINWGKRGITDTEKILSGRYFNQKYIDTFNKECASLNGNFGVIINHTGSGGTSFRQLHLKGKNPSIILSEGEQKVIALSDFLSEMQLSEINRGIIFDDPVTSLDEKRKKQIAERIAFESKNRQVIVFTHDLVFVSAIITHCEDNKLPFICHWVEKLEDKAGHVWLNNSPSYEKEYRNAEIPKKHYADAKKEDCPPTQREFYIKTGFTALRTCYEVLVINDLFKNVVQRYNERVSVDTLSSVSFNDDLITELLDSFGRCCRYMEGHTHSDKYAYQKPEASNLNEEIQRFETLRTKIKRYKKPIITEKLTV